MSTKKTESVQDNAIDEKVTPTQAEAPQPKTKASKAKPAVEPVYGVVSGCVKLRVRKDADIKSNVLREIAVNTRVQIDMNESTPDWYKVYVKGIHGFCMKKYITVK